MKRHRDMQILAFTTEASMVLGLGLGLWYLTPLLTVTVYIKPLTLNARIILPLELSFV
jgi:hypothetical protein